MPDSKSQAAMRPSFPPALHEMQSMRDESLRAEIRELSAKVDALHAALVKPQSSIIIVSSESTIMGDKDIARIVAELTKHKKGGAA